MTSQEALKIYNAGQQVVVETLCSLSQRVESLNQTVESLNQTVESLEKKIKSLEIIIAKLSKDSSNSSKPPSSDDITKQKSPKKSKGQNHKIGGQLGHPKYERASYPQEDIDVPFDYKLKTCPDCHSEVILLDGEPRVVQQVEIEEVVVTREEHRSYPVFCRNCQNVHYMSFPPEVVKEGLFKERLTALVAYMKYVCHASFSTVRKYIRDVLGEKVSRGYLRKVIEKVSQSLERPYEELLKLLPLELKLNVDETGHKENGSRFWTWVFRAELYVLFKIDQSRGSKVLIDVLGKEFNGVLGCDYFSAYRKYMNDFNITVQFCLAHLIRDIRFLISLQDAATKAYGQKLLQGIKSLFNVIHRHEEMPKEIFEKELNNAKSTIIKIALEDVPSLRDKEGKEQKREAQNMANRFRTYGDAYFEFITNPQIDPTNNVAEQAIRFVVIDRHVTQGTRGIKGRVTNERLWTVIATCQLQGKSAFQFILKAVHAYFHSEPIPSLLPNST